MTINLKNLIGSEIMETESTRMLNIKGVTKTYKAVLIPSQYCKFNILNGRISTYVSKYIADGNTINEEDVEAFNSVIEDFIEESNPKALASTKKNIDFVGQLVPGVVLNDGTIVDGNRRFTAVRKLQEEGKQINFLAVILDEEEGISKKDIKFLELQLQHAEEERIAYNPIDYLVDVYRDVIENKLFTTNEYAVAIGKDPAAKKDLKDVTLLIKKAVLMAQFLEFISAPKQYYIARDFALDGPLQEMVAIIEKALKGIDIITVMNKDYHDKNEQAQYIRIRNSLFATIFAGRANKTEETKDLSRYIRDTGKCVINSSNSESFLKQMDEIVYDMMEEFEETTVTLDTIKEVAKNLSKVNKEIIETVNDKVEENKLGDAQYKPVATLKSAAKHINNIDIDQIKHLDDAYQHEFILIYEQMKEKLEALGKALHV